MSKYSTCPPIDGDDIETAPLEREISLSPAEFKVDGKTIKAVSLRVAMN